MKLPRSTPALPPLVFSLISIPFGLPDYYPKEPDRAPAVLNYPIEKPSGPLAEDYQFLEEIHPPAQKLEASKDDSSEN